MQLEKYALPLSVAASIAAIIVFLKTGTSGNVAPTNAAALPTPVSVPTFQAIPYSTYNPATPTPPPQLPGVGVDLFAPTPGITANKGFIGAPTRVREIPNPNGCGGCGEDYSDGNSPFVYYMRAYQNSAAL